MFEIDIKVNVRIKTKPKLLRINQTRSSKNWVKLLQIKIEKYLITHVTQNTISE
jgi:hypothetical protein